MSDPFYYRCPLPTAENEADRLAWLRNTKAQSYAWLQTQPSYKDFNTAIQALVGDDNEMIPDELSTIRSGELRRCTRELVAALSNLRVGASFKSDVKALYNRANVLNQLYRAWWFMTKPVKTVRGALQMAAALGSGFIQQEWDPDYHRPGRGDVRTSVKGPHQVLPVQLPADFDYQRAYAVHLVEEMPIAMAHRKFWAYANKIVSDRNAPTWLQKGLERVQQWLAPVLRLQGISRVGQPAGPIFPTVDVMYTYIDDRSVNESGHDIQMGEQGTSWAYTVPSLGSDVPSGTYDAQGQPLYRKATYDDARIYPLRRLIIWTETCVIYDDTSRWWHGKVPITQFSLDKWVFDALGVPISKDTASYDTSMTRIMRAIDDSAVTRLDPPLMVNERLMDEDTAATFRVRQPGVTFRMDSMGQEAVKPVLHYEQWNLPPYIADWVRYLSERVQRLTGTFDAMALTKARQMPAAGTMEKINEMMGPLLNDMTTLMEGSMAEMGEQWKWLTFQFRTKEERMQFLGEDGETMKELDYEPWSLVPSHMPWEQKILEEGLPSPTPAYKRAQYYAGFFSYQVVPGQMHQLSTMSKQLMILQLEARGMPIDPWTKAELFNLSDFGPPPEGTKNVMERYVAWKRMEIEMAVELQKKMQALGMGDGQSPAPFADGQKQGPGRPATGMEAPRIVQKDGGTRSTISQSGS
jgi:hypothetical protein